MKTCPYCRKRIDVQATKCPHCASAFDGSQMETGRREVSRQRWGSFWLVILAIAAGIWWLATPGNVEDLARSTAEADWRAKHGKLPNE